MATKYKPGKVVIFSSHTPAQHIDRVVTLITAVVDPVRIKVTYRIRLDSSVVSGARERIRPAMKIDTRHSAQATYKFLHNQRLSYHVNAGGILAKALEDYAMA